MSDLKNWQYNDINKFKSQLTIDEASSKDQINKVLESTKGQAIMDGAIEIKANAKKKTGTVKVTDHVTLIKNTDKDKRFNVTFGDKSYPVLSGKLYKYILPLIYTFTSGCFAFISLSSLIVDSLN